MGETVTDLVKKWWNLSEYSGELDFDSTDDIVKFTLYTRDNKYKTLIKKDRIHCVTQPRTGDNSAPSSTLVDEEFSKDAWDHVMQAITQKECKATTPATIPEGSVTDSDVNANILVENDYSTKSQLFFSFMV